MKFIAHLICLFVPSSMMRKRIRDRLYKNKYRYEKSLRNLAKLVNFQIETIDGVSVIVTNQVRIRCATIFGGYINDQAVTQEVFGNNTYHFTMPKQDKAVVIDIGMNTGQSSLYFALRDDVKAVYGFEPVKETFDNAGANFKLNLQLAKKITSFNFGLGKGDRKMEAEFHPGASGIFSVVEPISKNMPERYKAGIQKVSIQIRDAAEQIEKIIGKHSEKIVLKCDCEGAELEIFKRLHASGLLAKIDVVVMEYHFDYKDTIEDLLRQNNFAYFTEYFGPEFGFIRAVNLSSGEA